jgi:hypothetical protein
MIGSRNYLLKNRYSSHGIYPSFEINNRDKPKLPIQNLGVNNNINSNNNQSGSGLKWYDRKLGKGIQEFPGEKHIPLITPSGIKMAQFAGPGTNVEARLKRGDKGINYVDAQCKKHDIDYVKISKMPSNKKSKNVRRSDNVLIKNLKPDKSINSKVVQTAIKGKKLAEDMGLLDKNKFVGGKKLLPHERLKLSMMDKNKTKEKKYSKKLKDIINNQKIVFV